MSKSLIKLVDSAIFPASLLVLTKVAGIFLVNSIFNLEWGIDQSLREFNLFSVQLLYLTKEDMIIATTYSNLFMFMFVLIGILFKIFQIKYLHENNINPKFFTKLAENNLLGLIKNSYDLYLEGFLWVIFGWIAWIIIFVNTLLGLNSYISCVIILTIMIFVSTLFLRHINKELELSKKNIKI